MSLSHVTILTETYAPVVGGGEVQASRLAEGLARRGIAVTLITRRVARGLARDEQISGVAIHRVPPAGRGALRKWALAATTIPELLAEVGRSDVFVVCGYRILGIPTRLVGAVSGIPCVFKADSQGEMSGSYFRAGLARLRLAPDSALIRPACWLRRQIVAGADAFVAISSPVASELVTSGIGREQVHSIPNGVDPRQFQPARTTLRASLKRSLGLPADGFTACFTGRLVRYKGLFALLDAWERVAEAVPGASLLLVGEGGFDAHSCEEELRQQVESRGMRGRVRFVGAVDDVVPYLRASDAFVFPTEREAFGLSLVEAMACGLPCVTTGIDGLADFVEHGRNALVVEPGDVEAIASAILRLHIDPGLAAELARAARETAATRFSSDAVVDRWQELLSRIVSERQP